MENQRWRLVQCDYHRQDGQCPENCLLGLATVPGPYRRLQHDVALGDCTLGHVDLRSGGVGPTGSEGAVNVFLLIPASGL